MSLGQDYLDDYLYEEDVSRQEMEYWDNLRQRYASQKIWLSQHGPVGISKMSTDWIKNCLEFIKHTPNEELYTPLFLEELEKRKEN